MSEHNDKAKNYGMDAAIKGAAVLDEKFPNWWVNIDLDTLSLSSGTDCILGQQFGSFDAGLNTFSGLSATEHGWQAGYHDDAQVYVDYEHLNPAWREVVEQRQAGYRIVIREVVKKQTVRTNDVLAGFLRRIEQESRYSGGDANLRLSSGQVLDVMRQVGIEVTD